MVVDSQKTPTNRHVHQAIQDSHGAPRQEPECCKLGRNEPAKSSPQGNSLRRVSQCGTGWSRNSTSPGFSPGSKSKASASLIFRGRTGRYSHPSALAPILLQASNRFFRPLLCDCRDARIARDEFTKFCLDFSFAEIFW